MPNSRWTPIATKSRTRQGAQWRPTPDALISIEQARNGVDRGTHAMCHRNVDDETVELLVTRLKQPGRRA